MNNLKTLINCQLKLYIVILFFNFHLCKNMKPFYLNI